MTMIHVGDLIIVPLIAANICLAIYMLCAIARLNRLRAMFLEFCAQAFMARHLPIWSMMAPPGDITIDVNIRPATPAEKAQMRAMKTERLGHA